MEGLFPGLYRACTNMPCVTVSLLQHALRKKENKCVQRDYNQASGWLKETRCKLDIITKKQNKTKHAWYITCKDTSDEEKNRVKIILSGTSFTHTTVFDTVEFKFVLLMTPGLNKDTQCHVWPCKSPEQT